MTTIAIGTAVNSTHCFFDTSRRSPPWSHGPDRGDRRDGDPRFTAEIAETAEMGPEPGGRVG
ncbi:MAG TPA: hypothetical protein VFF52_23400, partial [Isosphaeraceae bacterium]|nr:hypothetical protein [Isosphaeraceae bacterium]